MKKGKILVVDDDQFFRSLYVEILEKGGFHVIAVSSGAEAIKVVREKDIDLVFTDLMMPDMNGQEVLEQTKQIDALIDVVVITGHGTIDSAIKALKTGASDYIRKPVNEDELLLTANRCIDQKRLIVENRELKRSLKLFEVSRTLTTCLDLERLYCLTLDAIIQEVLCNGGGGFFCTFDESEKEVELKAFRNMEKADASALLTLFKEKYLAAGAYKGDVSLHDMDELTGGTDNFSHYCTYFLVPVKKDAGIAGYTVIFCTKRKGDFGSRDIENVTFIADQAALSFTNVDLYVNAQQMAYMDSLTDLYNMRFLDISIDLEVKRFSRSKTPFSVLFLDLDYFKNVNDVYGHLVGSKVLIEVGEILLKCVREVDTVIRYGGDEFTVVLIETDHDVAFKVAERMRRTIEKNTFMKNEGLNLKITVSIGLATYPSHAQDKKDLIHMADTAMYAGKNRSRNTVYIAPLPEEGAAS